MGRRRYYGSRYWANVEKANEVSAKLTDAFKLLRKQGLIARKNFMCCQNCAGYALATSVSEMPEAKRAKVKGTVFYHNQDNAGLKRSGEVYLAYGPLETEAHGTIGLPDTEVGKMVVEALTAVGLAYEWDGDGNTRILAKMPEPPTEGELAAGSGI